MLLPYNKENTQQPVILLCGVPGSGKSWVAQQVQDKYTYLDWDDYDLDDLVTKTVTECHEGSKPVLITCPFRETLTKAALESRGLGVTPIFIVELPETVIARYEAREKAMMPRQHQTRLLSIKTRAIEWDAFHGTSEEVLQWLKTIVIP